MPLNSPQQNLAQNLQAFFGQSYGLLVQRTIQALGAVFANQDGLSPVAAVAALGSNAAGVFTAFEQAAAFATTQGATLAALLNNFTAATITILPAGCGFSGYTKNADGTVTLTPSS